MGFIGSTQAMIQSIRANRAQLKSQNQKGYFEKDVDNVESYGKFEDHKKMTPEQFAAFKAQVKQREAENTKRLAITFGIAVVIIVSGVVYFMAYF